METPRKMRPVLPLNATHLSCLAPEMLLNDEVLNFYLRLVERRSSRNQSLPSVFAFDTMFFFKLRTQGADAARAFHWHRRETFDLFKFDFLIVPVHVAGNPGHWWLLAVDMLRNTIAAYDSIPGNQRAESVDLMEGYLEVEEKRLYGKRREWITLHSERCQRQNNNIDCGLHCARNAEALGRGQLPRELSPLDADAFRRVMATEITNERLTIADEDEVDWTFDGLVAELERLTCPDNWETPAIQQGLGNRGATTPWTLQSIDLPPVEKVALE